MELDKHQTPHRQAHFYPRLPSRIEALGAFLLSACQRLALKTKRRRRRTTITCLSGLNKERLRCACHACLGGVFASSSKPTFFFFFISFLISAYRRVYNFQHAYFPFFFSLFLLLLSLLPIFDRHSAIRELLCPSFHFRGVPNLKGRRKPASKA